MNISEHTLLHPSDPGAPRLRLGVAVTLAIAAAGAAAAAMLATGWTDAAVLGVALVVAELLPVRLPDGRRLSSWHAVSVPLAGIAGLPTVLAVALGARVAVVPALGRRAIAESVERLSAVVAAHGGFRLATAAFPAGTVAGGVAGFVVAAAATLAVDAAWRRPRHEGRVRPAGALPAALAVGAGGVLMGLAVVGVGDRPRMGLWGLPLFGVVVLASRYAFGRLHAIRRAYDQTIEVLSVVPEMGGLVSSGHARRVADLCVDVGARLGLGGRDLADLERSALLHGLGRVTFDEPGSRPRASSDVARATGDMLRGTADLSRPATILTAMPLPHRSPVHHVAPDDRRLAQILKVVVDFVDAGGGESRRAGAALEQLFSAPGYVYDARVLDALERVVGRSHEPIAVEA